RDAEVALPGDQPVAVEVLHPVLVARAHERRVPFDLTSPGDELISQLCRPAAVADVPLAAGDDLEWLVTLLIARKGMGDRFDLAEEVDGVDDHRREFLALAEGVLAGHSLIVGDRIVLRGGGDPLGDLEVEPTAAVDDRTRGQIEFAPPGDVGEVAE